MVTVVLLVHPVLQRLQLSPNLSRQISSDLLREVRPQLFGLSLPERLGHIKQGSHIHAAAQAFSVDGALYRQPADDALLGRLVLPLPAAALEDPLQHAGILAKAGPEERTAGVLSEPVDVEDLGQLSGGLAGLHAQPVTEVVAKVVAEEWSHGEGVVHNDFT